MVTLCLWIGITGSVSSVRKEAILQVKLGVPEGPTPHHRLYILAHIDGFRYRSCPFKPPLCRSLSIEYAATSDDERAGRGGAINSAENHTQDSFLMDVKVRARAHHANSLENKVTRDGKKRLERRRVVRDPIGSQNPCLDSELGQYTTLLQ